MLPFNIELMNLSPGVISRMQPITSLDHYDGGTKDFHDEGLFSSVIFGPVGSDARDVTFSYINIKVEIFHPVVHQRLTRLKGLYKGIMSGRAYALWDNVEKDFMPSDELNGNTGYHFFMKHWKDIKFKETKSLARKQRVELIEKYKDNATVSKVLVMPAGLRDLIVDENGREKEDDINDLYRRLLSISNTIVGSASDLNSETYNVSRNSLQGAFNDLYFYLENVLTGKKGFLQKKWASRRVFHGTRNVISAMDTSVEDLDDPSTPDINVTMVGLLQLSKAALPLTKHFLMNSWLAEVFGSEESQVRLINPKTLELDYVDVKPETYDKWFTSEGMDKLTNSYIDKTRRHLPVIIEGHYLALVYLGKGTFKVFRDIKELPDHLDRKDVHPMTLTELIYLSGFERWNTLKGFITRYPITGPESIYPSNIYVKTTDVTDKRVELDENWDPKPNVIALEYPRRDVDSFIDSLVVNTSKLRGLGAD